MQTTTLITIPEHLEQSSGPVSSTTLSSPSSPLSPQCHKSSLDPKHKRRRVVCQSIPRPAHSSTQSGHAKSPKDDLTHLFTDPRDVKIIASAHTFHEPYHVRLGKPKDLGTMLLISGRGKTQCNTSGQLAYLTTLAKDLSPSNDIAMKRTCRSSLPLNYVPFEPLFPGSRESKIKMFKAPSRHDDDVETFTLGMKWQKPRSLEELNMVPRLLGSVHAQSARYVPVTLARGR